MADTKISALPSGDPAQSADAVPIARAGSNFKITPASIAALFTIPNSTPPVSILPAGLTLVNSFGDSITSGLGLQGPPHSFQSWAALVAKALQLPITDRSQSGAQFDAVVGQGYLAVPLLTSMSAMLLGSNDIASGFNVAKVINGYECILTWLGLLAANKKTIQAAQITLVGSWSAFTIFNLPGVTSTTLGDTATASVSGTVVYVGMWTDSGVTDHFDILVDGVSQGPFTNTSIGGIVPAMIRIAGLAPGAHTVQVKVITGGDTATVQWIGGNDPAAGFPFVGVGNSIPRIAQDPTAFNTALAALVTTLAGDGLDCHLVNDFAALALADVPSPYQGDQTHPNTLGQFEIASFWLNALYTPLSFPGSQGVNGDKFAQLMAILGVTPERLAAAVALVLSIEPLVPGQYGVGNAIQTTDGAGNFTGSNATLDGTGNLTLPAATIMRAPSIVETATLSPTSAGTAGITGQLAWDGTNFYVCTAGGGVGAATWKAAALAPV